MSLWVLSIYILCDFKVGSSLLFGFGGGGYRQRFEEASSYNDTPLRIDATVMSGTVYRQALFTIVVVTSMTLLIATTAIAGCRLLGNEPIVRPSPTPVTKVVPGMIYCQALFTIAVVTSLVLLIATTAIVGCRLPGNEPIVRPSPTPVTKVVSGVKSVLGFRPASKSGTTSSVDSVALVLPRVSTDNSAGRGDTSGAYTSTVPVDVVGGGDTMFNSLVEEDSFFIKIPGGLQHVIPGSCVRSISETVHEVLESYANLLNVSSSELRLQEVDLIECFTTLMDEFSTHGFHERVLADARDFVIPAEMHTRDLNAYCEYNSMLASLAAARRAERAADRFNPTRCAAIFSGAPEYDRLMSLASDGVIIDIPSELEFPSVPGPPRKLQVKLQQVYSKHVYKVWCKMDGIVLPMGNLSEVDIASIKYNDAHLTHKPGGSRFLMDCSNSESGQVLNTPEVKERVIERYGPVVLCTFRSIVESWYVYVHKHNVHLRDCRLFKEDFQGAFAQLDISPECVRFLAIAVGHGLVLVYIAGLFGWLGFPMAYGVLSRAFEWLLRRDLDIPLSLYVDDIIALSLLERAASDQLYIENICELGMGSKAMNYEKRVTPCLSGDVLGWAVCLETETFRPCDKGIRKLMFGFWVVASGTSFPLVVYQMLASLSDFYSLGVPGMKPFSQALHGMSKQFGGGPKARYYKKAPTSAARMSIEIWRVAALLLLQRNKHVCCPLYALVSSVLQETHTVVVTDASPWGLGIGLYTPTGGLIRFMSYKFLFPESNHQNAREYFGYLVAFFFLEWTFPNDTYHRDVVWVGDNESALSWAGNNKCSSPGAHYAFLVVTWLQMVSRFSFKKITHQPGIVMGDIDKLSRGLHHFMDVEKEFVLSESQLMRMNNLFCLLDPSLTRNIDDHHSAFMLVVTIARDLLNSACDVGCT